MARGESAGSLRLRMRGALATGLTVMVVVLLDGGCTSQESGRSGPGDAALQVTTLSQSGRLDQNDRARLESEVSDVLATYVESGFLGDYPRSDFVQSFADFTSRAAEQAVGDIGVLTADRFAGATSVRATHLGAQLSFYVVKGTAVGVTAWINLAFDIDDHGKRATAALAGRLMLDRRDHRWSVFAYQVHRNDSDAPPTEASSP